MRRIEAMMFFLNRCTMETFTEGQCLRKTIRKYYKKEYITLNSKNNTFILDMITWSGRKRDFPIQRNIISKIIKVENLVSMEHDNRSFGLYPLNKRASEYIWKVCWCIVQLIRGYVWILQSKKYCCCRKSVSGNM